MHPARRAISNPGIFVPGEEIDADRLDHAYAVTVHRTQGATADRAHVFFDGGGPELAYVALSRARQSSTIHIPATTVDEAVDEIAYDWRASKADRWVTETATPGADPRHGSPAAEPATQVDGPGDRHARTHKDLARVNQDMARIRRRLDALERRPASPDLGPSSRFPAPDRGISL